MIVTSLMDNDACDLVHKHNQFWVLAGGSFCSNSKLCHPLNFFQLQMKHLRLSSAYAAAAAPAKSLQTCPILCNPIDGSRRGSPVPGILQARTLEWVAISFSNAWKWKVKVKMLSRIWLLATPWIVYTLC